MGDAKLRVAIIGAGIGGLVLALSLHRFSKNVSVDIYEYAAELTEHGAGIAVWERPWKILVDLGLEKDLQTIANREGPAAHLGYRKSDQQNGVDFHNPTTRYGMANFHRGEFQQVLSKHLPPSYTIHFSKKLVSYTEPDSGEIVLNFQDGSLATCDVIVGCDGVRSVVRGTLYRSFAEKAERNGDNAMAAKALSHVNATHSGFSAYRGLFPTEKLLRRFPNHKVTAGPLVCFGKNRNFVVYPVSQGRAINVVVFFSQPELEGKLYDGPWMVPAETQEMVDRFHAWEPEAKGVLECMENVSLWAVNTVVGLPTFVGRRVALLGDAAHAMTPHHGSGAGQAFEDAYILASVLGHPSVTLATVDQALHVYDAIRRPFVQDVQRRSHYSGKLYQLSGPECQALSEEDSASGAVSVEKLAEVANAIDDTMNWMGMGSGMSERTRALNMLECSMARSGESAPAAVASVFPMHRL
ncbi:FAD/NAD(P)-binding domain-containing protein [Sparassis crispa]|uniref:FAD/NAD(P)-binding domain-containing protein n=1 Tax=Sparassis crispa TaxID=139825 RepID=A0A401GU88_9APHY|nr:FAD/NAD(P)-binding domain-containing protein [Sparassis crispa]GBE85787.1 FAD/NAD(P)-binding domain-containing protein [Sparassis crispa]